MKNILGAFLLVSICGGSTPFVELCAAQTSIYKAPISGPSMGTQRVALTYRAIFDIAAPISGEVFVTVPFPRELDDVQNVEKYSFGSAMTPEKLLSISLQRDMNDGDRLLLVRVLNPAPGDELIFEYVISRKERSNSLDVPINADARSNADNAAKIAVPTPAAKVSRDEEIKMLYHKIISFLNEPPNLKDRRNGRAYSDDEINALLPTFVNQSGITAQPETGVLIPIGKDKGEIIDGHTWTNLFHPQRGLVPIDPFEAVSKKRYENYYLGNIPSDHISFAVGEGARISARAEKFDLLQKTTSTGQIPIPEIVPMKMKISFKRLPTANPMIMSDQSSGVE